MDHPFVFTHRSRWLYTGVVGDRRALLNLFHQTLEVLVALFDQLSLTSHPDLEFMAGMVKYKSGPAIVFQVLNLVGSRIGKDQNPTSVIPPSFDHGTHVRIISKGREPASAKGMALVHIAPAQMLEGEVLKVHKAVTLRRM
jgi:hypothetical protein